MPDEALQVRQFWLGRLPLAAGALSTRLAFWFGAPSPEQRRRDKLLNERFGALVERAFAFDLDGWGDSPRRRLSLILLLDAFARILYQGTARAFAGNERALALTLSGIQSGADAALSVPERIFFYMPLQQAESGEAQQESLAAFRRLLQEAPEELRAPLATVLRTAEVRHELIGRFGRFPERNHALGRSPTREELRFLAGQPP
jgi:uncharacterized protein (DUF924 family)